MASGTEMLTRELRYHGASRTDANVHDGKWEVFNIIINGKSLEWNDTVTYGALPLVEIINFTKPHMQPSWPTQIQGDLLFSDPTEL